MPTAASGSCSSRATCRCRRTRRGRSRRRVGVDRSLVRRFHEAARDGSTRRSTWSQEMADPDGADRLPQRRVPRERRLPRRRSSGSVGLRLRRPWPSRVRRRPDRADVRPHRRRASTRARLGWEPADRPARLRLVADAYGLDDRRTAALVEVLAGTIAGDGEFVLRRVEAGDPNFIEMWNDMGGMERFDRRRAWWAQHRSDIDTAMRSSTGPTGRRGPSWRSS